MFEASLMVSSLLATLAVTASGPGTMNRSLNAMAHLFGEWVEDEHGKCGVQVDVIYEPPQQVGISVEYRRGGRMA